MFLNYYIIGDIYLSTAFLIKVYIFSIGLNSDEYGFDNYFNWLSIVQEQPRPIVSSVAICSNTSLLLNFNLVSPKFLLISQYN